MRWQQIFSMHTCIRWDFASFQLTLPLSLSSSISCVLCWVLALITDASAHFDNCEQCACSRGLVYALSYVGCLLALCAHLWFSAFCTNPVEHLEVRRHTVVCQRHPGWCLLTTSSAGKSRWYAQASPPHILSVCSALVCGQSCTMSACGMTV